MTTPEHWSAVDDYLAENYLSADPILEAALAASAEADLPAINVAPHQGKFLATLAQSIGTRHLLEIGTLGAYSTIWLGRILPADGRLITLEASPKHAEVARANLERAGLTDKVEIRLGPALETLPQLAAEGHIFDFVFIDADKPNTPAYFEWALKLTRRGGLIITDNVIRKGAIIETDSDDPNVRGMREFHALLGRQTQVTSSTLQTVGHKGYDGFTMSLVL